MISYSSCYVNIYDVCTVHCWVIHQYKTMKLNCCTFYDMVSWQNSNWPRVHCFALPHHQCTRYGQFHYMHCQTSVIRHTFVGNKIVDHSDVVGASPVGAAPATSSFSTEHLASMDWAKTALRRDEKRLSYLIWCDLYQRFDGTWIPVWHQFLRQGSLYKL